MKVSSPSMLGLLACSGVGYVAAKLGSSGIGDKYVYIAYYSDSSCSKFAGIKPVFPNSSPTIFTKARKDSDGKNIPCYDAMACLYSPDDPTCKAFGELEIVSTNFTLDKGGNLYQCDPSNVAIGQPECNDLAYSECFTSSIYNCHWLVFTEDMFMLKRNAKVERAIKL